MFRPVTYKNYPENILKQCPSVRLITEYIKRWNYLLQSDTSINSLFITYRKPIRAAYRDTIMARWTKNEWARDWYQNTLNHIAADLHQHMQQTKPKTKLGLLHMLVNVNAMASPTVRRFFARWRIYVYCHLVFCIWSLKKQRIHLENKL